MTTPSHPWKVALERRAKALQEIAGAHGVTAATRVKLEESVVLGCYTIRKLINAFLLPESRCHDHFPMTAFPRRHIDAPVVGDEPLRIRYDLEAGRIVQHDLMFLCHQVLQNCVFEPWCDADRRLSGVHVTSDHQRKVALYGVKISALSDLFNRISAEGGFARR